MADLSITAANIKVAGPAQMTIVEIGEDMTGGFTPVYLNADGKYWKADNNVTVVEAKVVGVILLPATVAIGYGLLVRGGPVVPGATITAGARYILSGNAGMVAPYADIATGRWVSDIGYGVTSSVFMVKIFNTGIQHG